MTKSEILSKRKEELAQILTSKNIEFDTNASKSVLVEAVLTLNQLDNAVPITNDENNTKAIPADTKPETINKTPNPYEPEWTDYLLNQLLPHEKPNNKPNNVGLRRLCHIYIGRLLEQKVHVHTFPSSSDPSRACVTVSVSFEYPNGARVSISDGCDVSAVNTSEPYIFHPVATAISIAESRCFKKLLCLNTLAAEESQAPTGIQMETAQILNSSTLPLGTPNQKQAIKRMSKNLGIDIVKLLGIMKGLSTTSFEMLNTDECQQVMKMLNVYDRKEVVIPQEILE